MILLMPYSMLNTLLCPTLLTLSPFPFPSLLLPNRTSRNPPTTMTSGSTTSASSKTTPHHPPPSATSTNAPSPKSHLQLLLKVTAAALLLLLLQYHLLLQVKSHFGVDTFTCGSTMPSLKNSTWTTLTAHAQSTSKHSN